MHVFGPTNLRCVFEKTAGLDGLKELGVKDYLRGWLNHSAINAGGAARDLRFILQDPHHAPGLASVLPRAKRFASNALFTVLPPTSVSVRGNTILNHHTVDELRPFLNRSPGEWFKDGYLHRAAPDVGVAKTASRFAKYI